jgi:hypothetical protein
MAVSCGRTRRAIRAIEHRSLQVSTSSMIALKSLGAEQLPSTKLGLLSHSGCSRARGPATAFLPDEHQRDMRSFPFEIVQHVFNELETSNLCSLARVCRSFRPEAQRIIHRTVEVPRDQLSWMVVLFKRICSSPRLASYIREIDASLLDYYFTFPDCEAFISSFVRLFSQVLQCATNLRHVFLVGADVVETFENLDGLSYRFKLRSIMLDCGHPIEPCLFALLVQQDSLRCLEFGSWSQSLGNHLVEQDFLPNLSTFRGHIDDAVRIVPNRPVTRLFIKTNPPFAVGTAARINDLAGSSSKDILCLGLEEDFDSFSLSCVPKVFLSLERLVLASVDSDHVSTKHPQRCIIRFLRKCSRRPFCLSLCACVHSNCGRSNPSTIKHFEKSSLD